MRDTTEIKPKSQFWLIVKRADPQGYQTGFKFSVIELVEFDNHVDMLDYHEHQSVMSGESGGDYVYKVIAQSYPWSVLDDWKIEEEMYEAERLAYQVQ